MTVDEALAKGFSLCIRDGYSYVEDLDDVDEEDLRDFAYWICETEPVKFTIDARTIRGLIEDYVEGREDISDESFDVIDRVKLIPETALNALAQEINKVYEDLTYWTPTSVRVIP